MALTPEEEAQLAYQFGADMQSSAPAAMASSSASPYDVPGAPEPAMAQPYDYAPAEPVQSVEPPQEPAFSPPADPFQVEQQTAEQETMAPPVPPGAQAPAAEPDDLSGMDTRQLAQLAANRLMAQRQRSSTGPANPMRDIAARSGAAAKDAESALQTAQTDEEVAAGMRADATMEAAQAQADALDQIAQKKQAAATAERAAEDEARARREQHRAAMDATNREVAEIQKKIEGTQIGDRRTTAQRVGAALALAMSGIGDAIARSGGNQSNGLATTMQVINDGIDRDMEEQKLALANQRGLLTAKQQQIQGIRDMARDDREADLLERDARLRAHQQELEAIRDASMSKETTANAAAAVAAIDQERARNRQNFETERLDKNQTRADQANVSLYQQEQARRAAAARRDPQIAELMAKEADGTISNSEMAELSKRRREMAEAEIARQKAAGGGEGALPEAGGLKRTGQVTEDDVKEAKKIVSTAGNFMTTVQALKEASKRGFTLSPTERAKSQELIMRLRSQWNLVLGDKSAPNEGQIKQLEQAFTNPSEANIKDTYDYYDSLEKDVVKSVNASLKPYNHQLDTLDERPYTGK